MSADGTKRALSKIVKQATTGTAVTPSPDEWVVALPQLDEVACRWSMEDMLSPSYLWFEDGDYYATGLGPGLEDREGRPLDRLEAEALLEGGLSHKPVSMSEVPE